MNVLFFASFIFNIKPKYKCVVEQLTAYDAKRTAVSGGQ